MVCKPQHDETPIGKILRVRREVQDELQIQLYRLDSEEVLAADEAKRAHIRGVVCGLRFALNKL